MMKTSSKMTLVLGLIASMAMASAAFADAGGGNPSDGTDNGNGNGGVNNGKDKGDGTPAAPEPGIWLMAAAGVALGGGYIVWRRKQLKSSPAA